MHTNGTFQAPFEDSVYLIDILKFFRDGWSTIVGFGLAGVLSAGTIVAFTPSQFQATAQVEMAKIMNGGKSNAINISGTSVEDPNLLIGRLEMPSTYTDQVIQSCALEDSLHPAESLPQIVNATPMKKVTTVVEVSVRRNTPELAKQCITSVFEMIRNQQAALLEPYIKEARQNLKELKARLQDNQHFLASMEKNGIQSAAYLAKRDETLFLMDQITGLERSIAQNTESRLISPIYVSPKPVAPKRILILALGVLSGLGIGILFVFTRKISKNVALAGRT